MNKLPCLVLFAHLLVRVCVEAHKLFRHVGTKISVLGPALTLHLWLRVGSQLAPPLWPHPVAAQLCSWGVLIHEERDGVVLGLLCEELSHASQGDVRIFPSSSLQF